MSNLPTPRDVVNRFIHDVKNAYAPESAAELVSPKFKNHTPLPTDLIPEGAYVFDVLRKAMPDLTVTVEDMIVEGERVATFQTFSGTFTGEFQGRPGDGSRITWQAMDIVTVIDGKLVDHWTVADNGALLTALGGPVKK